MTNTLPIPIALNPEQGLSAYLRAINTLPMLSVEQEKTLARRYRQKSDLEAARQLVVSHLRFVARIARGFSGYGLPQSDLIQEGNIGLMKAVKHYDPERGVRLVSFAVHWIKAEMYDYILRNWRIVKIATTKAQRKLFFNLRSAKKRLGWMNNDEVESVARDLGVSTKDVLEMEKRMSYYDTSFDGPVDNDEDENIYAPVAYLEDKSTGPEEQLEDEQVYDLNQVALQSAIESLDKRSRDIISKRWLAEDKVTLQDLADEYNISAERIRQIETSAMMKLRESFAS